MKLYIRHKPEHNPEPQFVYNDTLASFLDSYESLIYKPPLFLGDISVLSKQNLTRLLTFLEKYPQIDCFASDDKFSQVLLSRFNQVIKNPLPPPQYDESVTPRSYRERYNNHVTDYNSFISADLRL